MPLVGETINARDIYFGEKKPTAEEVFFFLKETFNLYHSFQDIN